MGLRRSTAYDGVRVETGVALPPLTTAFSRHEVGGIQDSAVYFGIACVIPHINLNIPNISQPVEVLYWRLYERSSVKKRFFGTVAKIAGDVNTKI